MKNLVSIVMFILVVFFNLFGIAGATPIQGTPTLNGSTTPVGIFDSFTGVISYYIPLDGVDGTYGDGTYGTISDTATAPINGPTMSMYLYFSIPYGEVGQTLILNFTDLDLGPYNDPTGFNERLILYGQGGLPNNTFESYDVLGALNDVNYIQDSSNNEISVIFSNLDIQSGGGDFWLQLGFEAFGLESGTWRNSCENLTATLDTNPAPVPEPATMFLFGAGIVGLGVYRKKLRKT